MLYFSYLIYRIDLRAIWERYVRSIGCSDPLVRRGLSVNIYTSFVDPLLHQHHGDMASRSELGNLGLILRQDDKELRQFSYKEDQFPACHFIAV